MSNSFILSNIAIVNSYIKNREDILKLFNSGLFFDYSKWDNLTCSTNVSWLGENIPSRIKSRMSQLSVGVCDVLDRGAFSSVEQMIDKEIVFFTAFGEIETTNQIIKSIVVDKYEHISPMLFHNSVHNTPLGYFTIYKKISNSCVTISDGLKTNISFINFIKRIELLQDVLTIVHGDEYSTFNELTENRLKLFPSFLSYNIKKSDNNKGFKFLSIISSLDELVVLCRECDNVFADRNTFFRLAEKGIEKLFCDYPIIFDNPCSIMYRLALPFYFELKGRSLVVELIDENFYCYEVNL